MAVTAIVAVADACGTTLIAADVAAAMVVGAEVGGCMSLVGAVTGNQELSKLGGEIGMVCGVSSMAYDLVGAGAEAASNLGSSSTDTLTTGDSANVAQDAAGQNQMLDKTLPADAPPATPDPSAAGAPGSTPGAPIDPNAPVPAATPAIDPNPAQTAAGSNQMADQTVPSAPDAPAPAGANAPAASAGNTAPVSAADANPAQTAAGSDQFADKTVSDSTPQGGPAQSGNSFFDKASKAWDGLSSGDKFKYGLQGVGAVASIPMQIAKGQREDAANKINADRVAQTSYGSAIPKGIISRARG